MAYERINWQNGEVGNTPLNANNLNRMDMAIEEHDQKIGDHDYEIENLKTGAQGITEELNKKMDRINPQGSGTFSIPAVNADNITAQTVEADEIKVTKVGSKGGTAPVAFDNDILVNGITTPIGSLASSASAKAESAERMAYEADRTAGTAKTTASTAYSRVQENIFRTDKLEGIVGGGVGESIPQYTYYNGKYLRPDGEIANYNDSARVIEFEINKNSDSGCNVIFKNVDLIPTDASILCGFYNAAGILLGEEMRGLIIMADFDEDTGKMTRQYISYCVVPAPYYAKYVRISGIANGIVDIAIQNTLSDAVAELQSRSTSALVLTNPSPLPATDGKKILGIDALGKSWQETEVKFAFVSGLITPAIDTAINQQIQANNTRCTSDILELPKGSVISAPSGYEVYLAHATSESGNIDISQVWVTTYTTAVDGYWRVVCRNKSNTSATITPSECRVIANISPTPSNPIPITNAKPEVTASDNKIPTSEISVGKNWSGSTDSTCTTAVFSVVEGETYIFDVAKALPDVTQIRCVWREGNSGSSYISYKNIDTDMSIIAPANAKICALQFKASVSPSADVVRRVKTYTKSNSISLPFDPESAGSAANELIVNEDGSAKIIKRVSTMDLGTLNGWTKATYHYWIGIAESNFDAKKVSASAKMNALCDAYSVIINNDVRNTNNAIGLSYDAGVYYFGIRNDSITSASALVESLRGVTFQYELATPIEIDLTAEEVAAVRQLMTYKGTTIIESEMDVVSVTYSGDIKAYIDYRINQIINPTALNEVAPMNLDETEE